MPSYRARNITIRLIASSLSDCTTSSPTTARGQKTQAEATRCYDALRAGTLLPEKFFSCLHDDRKLHIIGDDNNPVPLYVVHVGREIPRNAISNHESHVLTRHRTPTPCTSEVTDTHDQLEELTQQRTQSKIGPAQPFALAIEVEFSRNTVQLPSKPRCCPPPDLRYDVFLNGDLVLSDYCSGRKLQADERLLERIIISGKRVHNFMERPIVVVPKGLNARGELVESGRRKGGSAQDRWDKTGNLLAQYAKDLRYWLKDGEPDPPLAAFLETLATMDMPTELDKLQPSGAQTYGVIDVIVSKGRGITAAKDKYLHHPVIFTKGNHAEDVKPVNDAQDRKDLSLTDNKSQASLCLDPEVNNQPTNLTQQAIVPSLSLLNITNPLRVIPYQTQNSINTARLELQQLSSSPTTRKTTSQKSDALQTVDQNTKENRSDLAMSVKAALSKASAFKTSMDRSSSGRKTVEGFLKWPAARKSGHAEATKASGTFKTKKRGRPKKEDSTILPPAKRQFKESHYSKSLVERAAQNSTISITAAIPQTVKRTERRISIRSGNAATGTSQLTKKTNKAGLPILPPGVAYEEPLDTMQSLDKAWVTPALCKDSFVTYAEDGVWRDTMSNAGYLRQVKALKHGHFVEDEVVFATRYILC